jgi:hypothetical protein
MWVMAPLTHENDFQVRVTMSPALRKGFPGAGDDIIRS